MPYDLSLMQDAQPDTVLVQLVERNLRWLSTRPPLLPAPEREALEAQLRQEGGEAMLRKLRAVDPDAAARLHPADEKRIIRALEVYAETGRTITEHDRLERQQPPKKKKDGRPPKPEGTVHRGRRTDGQKGKMSPKKKVAFAKQRAKKK